MSPARIENLSGGLIYTVRKYEIFPIITSRGKRVEIIGDAAGFSLKNRRELEYFNENNKRNSLIIENVIVKAETD